MFGIKIPGFKVPKPKQFNYRPFYYNKEKDEFEERKRQSEAEAGILNNERSTAESRLRGKFSARRRPDSKQQVAASNRRILVILLGLMLILYLLIR